jgi:phosphoenolpyruvate---glycerone phosphotransferase subunit DhaL
VSAGLLRRCVLAAAGAVEAARDELCRLDAAAGDGDHGVTMALAARAVRQRLADSPNASPAELVTKVALAAGSVGGAIGPIYASGLVAVAATLRRLEPAEAPSVAGLLACAEAALAAITTLGRAKPGDKTILEALDPAVRSLREADLAGTGVAEALEGAAAAAREGAASSASMVATLGRASRLGERSRGLADPGASSFALVLQALATTYIRETHDRRPS